MYDRYIRVKPSSWKLIQRLSKEKYLDLYRRYWGRGILFKGKFLP